jgi:hypothetical protein
VISLIALSLVLGGTAVAATTTKHKDAKADTKLIRKLAPSLSVEHAKTATAATNATHAANADDATHATSADSATKATHATSADSATNATNAVNATNATHASTADSATSATNAANAQPTAFALVESPGLLNDTYTKNVGAVTVVGSPPNGPLYCLSGIPFTVRGGEATVNYTQASEDFAEESVGGVASGCPSGTQFFVAPRKFDGSGGVAAGFFVELYG